VKKKKNKILIVGLAEVYYIRDDNILSLLYTIYIYIRRAFTPIKLRRRLNYLAMSQVLASVRFNVKRRRVHNLAVFSTFGQWINIIYIVVAGDNTRIRVAKSQNI